MHTHETFLNKIEAFLERSGMAPTAFGKESVGDPNLVKELRGGRSLGFRLADKVERFIEDKSAALWGRA